MNYHEAPDLAIYTTTVEAPGELVLLVLRLNCVPPTDHRGVTRAAMREVFEGGNKPDAAYAAGGLRERFALS